MRTTILTCVVVLAGVLSPASAAIYYVDYDGGDDSNSGASPAAPWKHCPGDSAATDAADTARFVAGDTVIFKGGVHYRGNLRILRNGMPGNPIIYDGNTEGTFGEGRAVIDGADPLGGWTQCASATECNGNPNWANIYWTYIDPPGNGLFFVNLCEGDKPLAIAQDPNPADLFYQDLISNYVVIRDPIPAYAAGQMEYVDAAYFTQPDGFWGDDAYFALYARTNRVYRMKVTDYVAAENKIVFDYLSEGQYPAGTGRFSMFNALTILDQPGEYYVKLTPEPNGKHKIFVWPIADTNAMTLSARRYGMEIRSAGYVTVQGFLIEKQSNAAAPACIQTTSSLLTQLTIRDNIFRLMRSLNEPSGRNGAVTLANVRDSVVDNNQFIENIGSMALLCSQFNDSVASNNYITRCGSTAVDYYDSHGSAMLNNTLYDNRGMHANGLTAYLGCTDLLIEGNHVSFGNACLTAQDGSNFIIRNNVFDGLGTSVCIAFWALYNMENVQVLHNTLVNAGSMGAIYGQAAAGDVLTIKNNIIDGLQGDLPGLITHNLYTSLGNHALTTGDVVQTNPYALFVDPAAGNYHLLAGGDAVDAGSELLDVWSDFDGGPRPTGPRPDMGAFEADGVLADAGADQFVPDRGGDGYEIVTLDGSASTSPNGQITGYTWFNGSSILGDNMVQSVLLWTGTYTITLHVVDEMGLSNRDSTVITVEAVLVADAGADQELTDLDGDGYEMVMLDGSGSFDPAGPISNYLWTDEAGSLLAFGPTPFLALPVGTHAITLKVSNGLEQATDTVEIIITELEPLLDGDGDGDGDVDLDDFVILKSNFGRTDSAGAAEGDFDGDGDVDLGDFVLLKNNFGATSN